MSTSVNIFRSSGSSSSSGGGGGGKEEQTKSVTITENGTTTITPDEGKTLSRVNVNTEVRGAGSVGRGVYYFYLPSPGSGNIEWHECEGVFDNNDTYFFEIPTDRAVYVEVTTDGNEPDGYDNNFLCGFAVDTPINFMVEFDYEHDGEIFYGNIQLYIPEPD